jgi:hypothetical protein
MDDRCKNYTCHSYLGNSKAKRENLKANSFGKSGVSHHSRFSFFKKTTPQEIFYSEKNRLPVLFFVGESAEIPIFRFPEARIRTRVSYLRADTIPPFFNST